MYVHFIHNKDDIKQSTRAGNNEQLFNISNKLHWQDYYIFPSLFLQYHEVYHSISNIGFQNLLYVNFLVLRYLSLLTYCVKIYFHWSQEKFSNICWCRTLHLSNKSLHPYRQSFLSSSPESSSSQFRFFLNTFT